MEASALLLLLAHMSDSSVDIKPERVTAGQYMERAVIKALSAPEGALILLTLPTLQTKAASPRRHGDMDARSRPASVPPLPPPRVLQRGDAAAGPRHLRAVRVGWTGWTHPGGGWRVRRKKRDRDQSEEEAEGVMDEDRDERAAERE